MGAHTHTHICMQTRTRRDLRAGDTCAYMVNGKVIQRLAKRLEKTLLRSLQVVVTFATLFSFSFKIYRYHQTVFPDLHGITTWKRKSENILKLLHLCSDIISECHKVTNTNNVMIRNPDSQQHITFVIDGNKSCNNLEMQKYYQDIV